MNEGGFLRFLKQNGRSERTMRGYLECVQRFEAFLAEQGGRSLDAATPEDLEAFAGWSAQRGQGVAYLAIADYCDWSGNGAVRWAAHERFAWDTLCEYKLNDMMGVDAAHVQALKQHSMVTARDLLEAGDTPEKRAALSALTGIPPERILEMVKLADLARVGGVRKVRGRLYYDAGFDTPEAIAAVLPEELRQRLAEYIQASGFAGIPPTPKEALNAVMVSRRLKRVVGY